jgi:diphthamide biosynthesis protein 2
MFILRISDFSCCVDDVAAQHANCDSLVHYGESCLSKTSERMPILYVFGDFPVDLDDFRQKWNDFADNTDLEEHTIYLLCDSIFAHSQGKLIGLSK